jgi:NAD(P)-dependent dehydrogenase (short-subunit alcohol dehydrogenase family)
VELLNRVAIVTGSGRGIGEAVALAFANNGASVVLVSRTESALERVASLLKRAGANASVHVGDVSKPKDVDRIIDGTVREYGRIDILVNAAAIHGPIGRVWECDAETWSATVQVNLIGTFLCCRKVIPHMLPNGWGRIINFSGGGATAASPFLSAYGASKAAIVRLTETLAAELIESGIQVNAIAPGLVDTGIHDDLLSNVNVPSELIEPIRAMREKGRGCVTKELPAQLAVFLASSRSSGLSGKLIAAPYDNWQTWKQGEIEKLMSTAWLTLRRVDPFTVNQLSVFG